MGWLLLLKISSSYRLHFSSVKMYYIVQSCCWYNAALTHKPRPYCDLKTTKIALFLSKIVWFSFKFLVDGPGICSLVFSRFSLCPQYDPSTSMAFPLRLYCVPKATPRRSSATQLRLCYVLCVLTATLRRLLCLSGDCTTTLLRPCYVYKNSTFFQ